MNLDLLDLLGGLQASAVAPFAVWFASVLICSTLILGCAWALTFGDRRWSAAIRHRIWFLSLCSVALVPFCVALLPSVPLRIIPRTSSEISQRTITNKAEDLPVLVSETNRDSRPREVPDQRYSPAASGPDAPASITVKEDSLVDGTAPAMITRERAAEDSQAITSLASSNRQSQLPFGVLTTCLIAIWGIGFVIVVSPIAVSALLNRSRFASSNRISDGEWSKAVEKWSKRLGIKKSITLLYSDRVAIPMVWGVVRPVLAIPSQGTQWSDATRRVVCLHELSHVKRQDILCQAIARIVCGMYWLHPLAWLALRKMRIERELACDDSVLAQGEKPTDYATQLVFFARAQMSSLNALTAAMATASNLSRRVSHALDVGPSRTPISRGTAWQMLCSAMIVTVCLTSLRVGYQSANPLSLEPGKLSSIFAATDNGEVFSGIVVDPEGHPIADARVIVVRTTTRVQGWRESHQVVAETTTGKEGSFELTVAQSIMDQMGDNGEHNDSLQIVAHASGYVPDWQTVHDLFKGVRQSGLRLELLTEPHSIAGRIIDQEGDPVSDLTVRIVGMSKAESDENVREWHRLAKENPSQPPASSSARATPRSIHYFPAIERVQTVGFPGLEPFTTTDENGRFQIPGLGANRLVEIEIEGLGFARTRLNVATDELEPVAYPTGDPRYGSKICYGPTFEFAIERDHPIRGVVHDHDTGEPLSGIKISVNSFGSERLSISDFVEAESDADGRFVLRGIPRPNDDERPVSIEVTPSRTVPYFPRARVDVPRDSHTLEGEFKLSLKKASWLSGRLIDDSTGEGVPGQVCYSPLIENEHVNEYSSFQPGTYSIFPAGLIQTDATGRFRIPVIPGEGILLALANEPARYVTGHAEGDLELPQGFDLQASKYFQLFSGDWLNTAKAVNFEDVANLQGVELRLVPRESTRIQLIDEDRNPLIGVRVIGEFTRSVLAPQQRINSIQPSSTADIHLVGIADSGNRLVACYHAEKNLGKVTIVGENKPQSIVLEPCSTIRGQVVGGNSDPATPNVVTVAIPESSIPVSKEDAYRSSLFVSEATINADGSFDVAGVLPGSDYVLQIQGRSFPVRTKQKPDEVLVIGSGETIDVGTIDLTKTANEADESR